MTTKEQQGRDNLAQILTNTLDKLAEEDQKKHAPRKKPTRTVQDQKTITKTQGRYKEATTEVNGKPTLATIKQARIEEDGHERCITEITVGKTTKKRYEINNRELEAMIDETATEEEDRLDKYGDLPF